MKQSSLSEIIKLEYKFLSGAPQKYGDFSNHAIESYKLLQSFIVSVNSEGWLFIAFLSSLKKHHLLAFFSAVRLHHVQVVMNLRQILESGANASYALANPDIDNFALSTPEGLLDIPKKLETKRYKWLEKNYPKGSEAIKSMKKMMQKSSHSNIVDTQRTFKYEESKNSTQLKTPFFDIENDFQIKSDLWSIANIAMGLMDLFYDINVKYKFVIFSPNFTHDLQLLEKENKRLKKILMKTLLSMQAKGCKKFRKQTLLC
jgi:hypothetical protein